MSRASMTPRLAFACALVYCAGADRELSPAEKSYLAIALSGPQGGMSIEARAETALTALSEAFSYCRTHDVREFLQEATPLLNHEQRLTILLNLVDLSLADGKADADEAAFVSVCLKEFGIDAEDFELFMEPIIKKNDRRQFGA